MFDQSPAIDTPKTALRLRSIREDSYPEFAHEVDLIDPDFDAFDVNDLFQFVTGE